MTSTCITNSVACPDVIPQESMCLKVINLTSENVNVTQVVASGTPQCFVVPQKSQTSVLVELKSTWNLVGATSGKIYHANAQPQTQYAVLFADSYVPEQEIKCSDSGPSKPKKTILIIMGISLLVIAFGAYIYLQKSIKPSAEYLLCLQTQSKDACKILAPSVRGANSVLYLGAFLSLLVLLSYLFFFTKTGGVLLKEAKTPISCADCKKRGSGWKYREPSSIDKNTSKITLWLRKQRCRLGGFCMCTNDQDRQTCTLMSYDSSAPKNLAWQADTANEDALKADEVCACCAGPSSSDCYSVRTTYPPLQKCVT